MLWKTQWVSETGTQLPAWLKEEVGSQAVLTGLVLLSPSYVGPLPVLAKGGCLFSLLGIYIHFFSGNSNPVSFGEPPTLM